MSNKQSLCPEYRSLRCVTRARCSYDRGRNCEVCVCDNPDWPEGSSSGPATVPGDTPPTPR
jgi:hypothetical protein